jgi:DNA polymerase-3 subunit gamma/tau
MTLLRMLAFRPGAAPAEEAPAPAAARKPAPAQPAARPAVQPVQPAMQQPTAAEAAPAARSASAISPARAALEAARGLKRGAAGGAASAPSSAAEAAPAAFVAAVPPKKAAPSAPPPWDDLPPFDDFEPAQKKTEPPAVAAHPIVREAPSVVDAEDAPPPVAVPELAWDGDWPQLASDLPVRGVAHQLAQQSELLGCAAEGGSWVFRLRVPVDTLCSAVSVEKLSAALAERFGKPVRIVHEIGPVRRTANAKAEAERAARQREAEQTMHSDPFLQTLMREFGATIVPGSIKPV